MVFAKIFLLIIISVNLFGCNNYQNNYQITPINLNSDSITIIGRGFENNNEKRFSFTIFDDCLINNGNRVELNESDSIFTFKPTNQCLEVELLFSTLIGFNERYFVKSGDTLVVNLMKNGIKSLQSKKKHWETNFYYEINKFGIGLNLFFTKYLFKNGGRKPTHKLLRSQYNYELFFLDSLANNELLDSDSKVKLIEEVTCYYLLNLLRMGEIHEYSLQDSLKANLFKKGNLLVRRGYFRNLLLNDFFVFHKESIQEDWEKLPKKVLLEEADLYYNGMNQDFLTFFILNEISSNNEFKEIYPSISQTLKSSDYHSLIQERFFQLEGDSLLTTNDKLKKITGEEIEFKDIHAFKGISYIDFWASWCAPCRAEIPSSKKLSAYFEGKPIQFVFISLDEKESAWSKASGFEGLNNFKHNYLLGNPKNSTLIKQFDIKTIPRYLILGQNGTVLNSKAPKPSDKSLIPILETYLKDLK
jgi:thiol-disulfide isomerase/thioredoxin